MSLVLKQTNSFKRVVKKLNKKQKGDLDKAVQFLVQSPEAGTLKKGDLFFIGVYKFKMDKQLTLLAYEYEEDVLTLTLMYLGAHENFYRDVKRQFH